jgi:hypothetical protein
MISNRNILDTKARSHDMTQTIDPGFINYRLIDSTFGREFCCLCDKYVAKLPSMPEGLLRARIANIYTRIAVDLCNNEQIKSLNELLSTGCGTLFCSTEQLKPCRSIYTKNRVSSIVQVAGRTSYKVVLEYSTSHIYGDTHRERLRSGDAVSLIAVFHRKEGETLFFHPLIMGSPWLTHDKDEKIANWAMWHGRDYFEHFIEDFDQFRACLEISVTTFSSA